MLRWWVLGVLLCNVIYFVWQRHEVQGESLIPALPPAQGAPLILLSGAGEEKKEKVKDGGSKLAERLENAAQSGSAGEVSVPVCHMIGPFKEKVSARQVKDRLAALEVQVNTYRFSIPGKPDYWVHLGPMRSRKEALDALRELHSKNIDSFLITEGELVNGVSLGFFTREELAQAALKMRREQGYDAKIREVPRFSEELWTVFADGQYARFSEDLWQQIRAGTQGLELRKNFCDAIASAEKLD